MDKEIISKVREDTGHIYDMCNALLSVAGEIPGSTGKQIKFLVREIRSTNSRVDTTLFAELQEAD